MGKAVKAFAEARRRIKKAKRTGENMLDLQVEGLEGIPQEIGGLTGLMFLYLSGARVSDLTAISGLRGLTGLYLSGTGVADLTAISGLTGLTWLVVKGTGVSDLTAISGLSWLTRLDLTGTGVGVADLKHLAGLERLVLEPDYYGLSFEDCAATREDRRVAEISRFKRPKQRARALFEYLETWVPPDPPEIPDQTTGGLRYRVGPTGLVGYDPRTTAGLLTDQQRQLHAFLVEDAGQVAGLFGGGHNQPYVFVAQKLERYGTGLGLTLDGLNPAVVWKVGNDLRLVLAADAGRRPGDMTNRPAFDVDQRAGLEGLISTHNALVSLHLDLAVLDVVAVDPARRHVAERDRALLQAAIEAFATQTRLILGEVAQDLRDLHDEAWGETRAAIRAARIEEESLENLIKAVVTQAMIEARGNRGILTQVSDAMLGTAVATVATGSAMVAGPAVAANYPQLVMALQPHVSALLSAWHGTEYPVSEAVNWVVAKVRRAGR